MRVFVVSDIHFAGEAERARRGWERRAIRGGMLRQAATLYRRFFWLADPTAHNHQLEAFIGSVGALGETDLVVANGDYSCDSGFIGLADDAAYASARECVGRLREVYDGRLLMTLGDHELGKMSLFGGVGGPRLGSWERSTSGLGVEPLWVRECGRHVLVGITSSLVALPVFEPEMVDGEQAGWAALRETHLEGIRRVFGQIPAGRRIVLFCHDPTALPYLAQEPAVMGRLGDLECTVIGHLHSELILRMSRVLTGMPRLDFLGNTARRLSGALRRARAWAPFKVVLCPSPPGVQLLKDGGYLEFRLGSEGETVWKRHRLPWRK